MAIDPVQSPAPVTPVQPQSGGPAPDVLAALKAGQTVDAVVLAQLETGEVRLGLLGVLLDILPQEPVATGDSLKLTVVRPGADLAVAVERLATSATPPAALPTALGAPAGTDAPAAAAGQPGGATAAPGGPAAQATNSTPQDIVDLAPAARQPLRAAVMASVGADATIAAAKAAPVAAQVSAEAKAALASVLPAAAANQQGRAPLISNAIAVLSGPAGEKLPPKVRETLAALVATALDPHGLDGGRMRDAILRSGSFQESSILKLAAAAAALPPAAAAETPAPAVTPAQLRSDAKSILLALRTALGALSPDRAAVVAPAANPPQLPLRGTLPAGQGPHDATLPASATTSEIAKTVLAGTDGALDRLRLVQAASLPPEARPSDPVPRQERLVEIPIAMPNGQVPVMSLAVGRDGGGRGAVAGEPQGWRMRLSLDLEPSGPMHALVALRGGRAGVTLWAERPETADAFRASLPELRDALTVADFEIDTIDVRDGAPAQIATARSGAFLDLKS